MKKVLITLLTLGLVSFSSAAAPTTFKATFLGHPTANRYMSIYKMEDKDTKCFAIEYTGRVSISCVKK